MSSVIGRADILNAYSGHKSRDLSKATRLYVPASAIVPTTAEVKAQKAAYAAYVAQEKKAKADFAAGIRSNPDLNPYESNAICRANVAELDAKGLETELYVVTQLIESGEAETRNFHGGNGNEGTTSIHQYLSWLQQRAEELNDDGTYSPAMIK